ncbi:MAG: hypothetical protein NTX00_02115 [Candidatus Parcubacteria bacterium]|nr:hypothetical protein [Candidatus Parcubacteria bacterium]
MAKFVIQQQVMSAGNVLLGQGTDDSIIKAFALLSRAETDDTDDFCVARPLLKDLCLQTKSWQEIAKIVVAAVAYRPGRSEKWLQIICEPFSLNLFKEDIDLLKENPAFILGTTLGLFQAINWLDKHWRTLTDFENDFYDEIAEVILWKDQFSDLADQLLPDPAYESQLSQAVKAFFRLESDGWGNKGIRIAKSLKLVQKVLSKLAIDTETKKELSKIGALVLEQMSYAWFGSASLMGRVNGIMLIGKKCDFDKKLAAKAFPKLYGDKELFSADMQALYNEPENSWATSFQMLAKAISESRPEFLWQIISQADEKIKGKVELSKQVQVLWEKIAYAIFDQLDTPDKALTAIFPITTISNEILSQSGRRLLRPNQ